MKLYKPEPETFQCCATDLQYTITQCLNMEVVFIENCYAILFNNTNYKYSSCEYYVLFFYY